MSAEWIMTGARLLQFASALVLFGSASFYLYGFSGSSIDPSHDWAWPRQVLLVAALTAFASTLLWVSGQAVVLTGESGAALDVSSLSLVLFDTRIGRICLGRLVLIALSLLGLFLLKTKPVRVWRVQAGLGGVLVASLAWSGHGARDHGWAGGLHLGGDIVHLLTAGVWIGALVPLAILVVQSYDARGAKHARAIQAGLVNFSGIGLSTVALLALSGISNSWFLIGPAQWGSLFTTAYGVSLSLKLVLFGLMMLLAVINRFVFTPELEAGLSAHRPVTNTLRRLRTSIIAETTLAFLVLAAVAYLGTQPPPVSLR
jgi:putative copper resistance protein D